VSRSKQNISLSKGTKNPFGEKKNILEPARAIVNAYTLIAVLYCASSTVLFYYVVENIFLAIIHQLALFSVVTNYLILLRTKNFNRATNIILTTGTVVVLSLFATGGWANTGYLWPFAYLPFVFFLSDRAVIVYWVAALFIGCLVVVLFHFTGAITVPYSPAALINYFAALLIFTVCIFLFQKATVKREEFLSYTETLLEAAPDAVIIIDNEGRIVKWNPKSETLFGWKADEVSGKLLSEIIIPHRYREANTEGLKHFIEPGEGAVLGKTIEIQTVNKNNIEFDVALSISPAMVQNKRLFIGFVRDITERKKVEEKIKESEHMFSNLFYKSPVMKTIAEASTGKYLDVNDAFADFFEQAKEDIIGRTSVELNMLTNPEERDKIIKTIQRDGFARDVETQILTKTGKTRWVSISIDKNNLNGKDCFLTAAIDITKRKEGEEKIKESGHMFSTLFYKSPVMKGITEASTGKYIEANDAFMDFFGLTKEQMIGKTGKELNMFVDPEHRDQIIKNFQIGGVVRDVEIQLNSKNGKRRWVSSNMNSINLNGTDCLLIVIIDITQRKEAEEKIRQMNLELEKRVEEKTREIIKSEKQYRILFENNPMPMWVIDLATFQFLDVNEAAASHYNYSREEFLSMTALDIRPEEEKERYKNADHSENIYPANYNRGTWKHLKKDGTVIYVEVIAHGIIFEGKQARLVLSNDVTEKIKAEQEIQKLNEELENRVRQRTEELEAFSYSVSHDLRTPLRAVNGYAKMLEEDYYKLFDDDGRRLLTVVQENAKKMGKLIDDLLAFSRLGMKEIHKANVDMKQLAVTAVEELKRSMNNRAEIKVGHLHSVMADPSLINQVMENLISNAIKYSSEKEKSLIEIKSEKKDGELIYSVSDNGVGFDMKYVRKLFGVFQRLHSDEEFEGTGVGLAIVHRIIAKHGGRVWAQGEPGKGATFYFTLPDHETIKNN